LQYATRDTTHVVRRSSTTTAVARYEGDVSNGYPETTPEYRDPHASCTAGSTAPNLGSDGSVLTGTEHDHPKRQFGVLRTRLSDCGARYHRPGLQSGRTPGRSAFHRPGHEEDRWMTKPTRSSAAISHRCRFVASSSRFHPAARTNPSSTASTSAQVTAMTPG